MPSHLRHESSFSTDDTPSSFTHFASPPPAKKQRKMSITQTYRLVHTARGKLSYEASRSEHDLRLLVGHANLLDSLMVELQQVEEDQESWFNNTVSVASGNETKHVVWRDELELPDSSDSDSDSDDEPEEPTVAVQMVPLRRPRSPEPIVCVEDVILSDDEDEDEDEDEEMSDDEEANNEELVLCRTTSRHADLHPSSPPELIHDSDDSDDESPSESRPTSPPQATLEYFQAGHGLRQKPIAEAEEALYEDGFYIPDRNQSTLIAAC